MSLQLFLVTLLISRSLGNPFCTRPKYQTNDYYTYEEIQEYLKGLADSYSSRVILTDIGKSFENRNLTTITISNGDGRKGKNVIFIDAGMHGREWITHTAALNIIDQLVVNFKKNMELLEDYDWVILPLVNADGYTYSRSGKVFTDEAIDCRSVTTLDHEFKCWRKNRNSKGNVCIGTDLNRNFGHGWGKGRSSTLSCTETYNGPYKFSEPESQAVQKVLLDLVKSRRGILYLTLHSAGSKILYPWGSERIDAENYKEHLEMAQAGVDAISNGKFKFPSNYKTIPSYKLYVAGGSSNDYAYKIGFALSMTWELPEKRGNLSFGFHPPTNLIKELVEETWIGIRATAQKVIQKYPIQKKSIKMVNKNS
ncbi:carboxypeptidase B-like [Drosophila subpulchrella]|uniref:carboxypeptidase B-like n=1 Tax=Drosophila subpulchrella TaxID=1486046 RepID=UPI0018A1603F|nr:carboxypeptidase B-like [Drosophila subpulchrella]